MDTRIRQNDLYLAAIRGGTPSSLVLQHMEQFALPEDEALSDWEAVVSRLQLDASIPNDAELARIRASRWVLVEMGLRRGQLAAAGNVLRDLGAASGEQQLVNTVLAQATPSLNVYIEAAPPEAAPVAIEAAVVAD